MCVYHLFILVILFKKTLFPFYLPRQSFLDLLFSRLQKAFFRLFVAQFSYFLSFEKELFYIFTMIDYFAWYVLHMILILKKYINEINIKTNNKVNVAE